MNKGYEGFLRISKGLLKAKEFVGKTVVAVNEDILNEACKALKDNRGIYIFGTKNTSQISRKYIKRLIKSKKFLWNTIDELSEHGRAVDSNLQNPLTFRPMTGSSSATAINVLYGINDIGIGTDGGGSVLAPALSLNLFSIMAKGMGLKGQIVKTSTDGIDFVPGIGVISHSFKILKESIMAMLDIDNNKNNIDVNFENYTIIICKKGNIKLPDGSDMNDKLKEVIKIFKKTGIKVTERDFPNFQHRQDAIDWGGKVLKDNTIIVTFEGPIDLVGIGDSVFGTLGSYAKSIQNISGKYMVKISNMLNATSVTIPTNDAASGIVITTSEGLENGLCAIALGEILADYYKQTQLYKSYFNEGYKKKKNDLIFSLDEV